MNGEATFTVLHAERWRRLRELLGAAAVIDPTLAPMCSLIVKPYEWLDALARDALATLQNRPRLLRRLDDTRHLAALWLRSLKVVPLDWRSSGELLKEKTSEDWSPGILLVGNWGLVLRAAGHAAPTLEEAKEAQALVMTLALLGAAAELINDLAGGEPRVVVAFLAAIQTSLAEGWGAMAVALARRPREKARLAALVAAAQPTAAALSGDEAGRLTWDGALTLAKATVAPDPVRIGEEVTIGPLIKKISGHLVFCADEVQASATGTWKQGVLRGAVPHTARSGRVGVTNQERVQLASQAIDDFVASLAGWSKKAWTEGSASADEIKAALALDIAAVLKVDTSASRVRLLVRRATSNEVTILDAPRVALTRLGLRQDGVADQVIEREDSPAEATVVAGRDLTLDVGFDPRLAMTVRLTIGTGRFLRHGVPPITFVVEGAEVHGDLAASAELFLEGAEEPSDAHAFTVHAPPPRPAARVVLLRPRVVLRVVPGPGGSDPPLARSYAVRARTQDEGPVDADEAGRHLAEAAKTLRLDLDWAEPPLVTEDVLSVVGERVEGRDSAAVSDLLDALAAMAMKVPGWEDALWLALVPGGEGWFASESAEGAAAVGVASPGGVLAALTRVFGGETPPTVVPALRRSRVCGSVASDGTVLLDDVLEESRGLGPGEGNRPGLEAVLRAWDGRELGRRPLTGHRSSPPMRVAALLPASEEVGSLEVVRGGRVIASRSRSRLPPREEFKLAISRAERTPAGLEVAWTVEHPTRARPSVEVRVYSGRFLLPVGRASRCGDAMLVPPHRLPDAIDHVQLVATDGWNTATAEGGVTVRPPVAVVQPRPGAQILGLGHRKFLVMVHQASAVQLRLGEQLLGEAKDRDVVEFSAAITGSLRITDAQGGELASRPIEGPDGHCC